MTNAPKFNPVVLFADDLEPIYRALVAAGRADLAKIIDEKATRSHSDLRYINARPQIDENEIQFDDVPFVSQGEDGAYVSCWIWVSSQLAAEITGNI